MARRGGAGRGLELGDDLLARVAECLEIRRVELVDQTGDEREDVGPRGDLGRPLADGRRHRPRVPADAGRVAEALRRVALLAVGDRLRLEGHPEVLADAAELRL